MLVYIWTSFLNKKDLFDHSTQRFYFINRNRIIVRKRYQKIGPDLKVVIRELLNLREIFVMSSPRISKFKSAFLGIIHGIFYK